MSDSLRIRLAVLLLLVAGWQAVSGGGGLPIPGATKPTAVTYVYEKDDTTVPNAVLAALDKLNRQGINAANIDKDIVDGASEVPDQFKVAIAAAKEAGLPALVATTGDRVVRIVKDPKTEEDVLQVAR